ncbi:Hint domain-containing protein [Xinfangfangia pollutisoli]|uniref:Hint domain-containing protein n=1 Tax=Xinfangfangia pollutisoli TaxID=2865960 RepID=UPI001CD6472F|nr:Hint domain-containing protein [Xinfangfangia pollutisoli]
MPVFALYNFNDASTVVDDAPINGVQNGIYLNGATAENGNLLLDGQSAFVKIYPASQFQMPQGTLEINFTPTGTDLTEPQTVLSRDSAGENQGSYQIQVYPDGSVQITHESEGASTVFTTGPGFYSPGDEINVTYSWDEGGTGGALQIENAATGGSYAAAVPNALTMDMADQSQPWMIGTGQAGSDPGMLNNLDGYFQGTVDFFSLSDTVDNPPYTGPDGIVRGTEDGDLIDTSYVDPYDGDRIDANDALIPGDGPNDDRVVAGGGNDTVYSGAGNDTVYGGDGDDLIVTHPDTIPLPDIGYPGLYPADSDPNNDLDLVYGGAGNDTIRTGDDADTIYGGTGNDLIDAGIDADLVHGDAGDDTIVGGEGADTIYGGDGDDLIYGGLNDVIGDALDIPDDNGDLVPNNNTDLLYGGAGNDTIYGRDDDDTLYGGAGNDLLYGGVDDDEIHGDAGNDTLHGDHGADSMYGGADRDVFVIANGTDGIGDFIDGGEEGDDYDTLDLSEAGPLTIDYDQDNPENGVVTFFDPDGNPTGTLNFINIENVIPPICFTPGTLIATPRGEVPVESLRPGDKVVTRDNGIQEIRWTGAKTVSGQDLRRHAHLNPVLVKAHSLGNGLPEQDMLLSPNHRVLVANDRTQLYFDEHEVLVAAKHLVGLPGVHAVASIGVTYIHFLCDRHEVVLSNGAWTESFQPGDYSLKGLGNAQRNEIMELFPELKTEAGLDGYQAARRTLKRHEAKILAK